jgi:hypothetical protein
MRGQLASPVLSGALVSMGLRLLDLETVLHINALRIA